MKVIKTLLLPLLNVFIGTTLSLPFKPNIVFVLVDDWGYQDVGYRGSNMLTPNIDSLATSGVILDNHYSTPLCAPTRAALMTGRYPIRTGYWNGNFCPTDERGLDLDETTMPEMLRRNGYNSHCVGKWHLGFFSTMHMPGNRGCETFLGFVGSPTQDHFNHTNGQGFYDFRYQYHHNNGSFIDEVLYGANGKYSSDLYTDRSLEVIKTHNKSNPLFLYLAFSNVHSPHQAPASAVAKVTAHLKPNIGYWRKHLAAMIYKVDEGIGKIVEQLKKFDMYERTILVVASDNGGVLTQSTNFPFRSGKRHLLEGGIRSGAFVHSPLLEKIGYSNAGVFHIVDWYTTFQSLAGDNPDNDVKPQLPVDGVNIWESISSKRNLPREELLLGYSNVHDCHNCIDKEANSNPSHFALRWGRWKLIEMDTLLPQVWGRYNCAPAIDTCSENILPESKRIINSTETIHLFDLDSDPRETTNLYEHYPYVGKTMLSRKIFYSKFVKPLYKVGNCGFSCFPNNTILPWIMNY